MPKILNVPTNIITGSLGVGKTTAICQVLKQKPRGERWAVLVNEFGEVGIDGGIIAGSHGEAGGVFVREIPGGCMCCASGLPMQIGLNMLLARAKPDRLLIEPTGLGHPKEVLQVLSADYYREVLQLQASLALVDARQLKDAAFAERTAFRQHLEIADLIVANKADLYEPGDLQRLRRYLSSKKELRTKALHTVSQGKIEMEWLQQPNLAAATDLYTAANPLVMDHDDQLAVTDSNEFPDCGFLKVENRGKGTASAGWRFSPEWVFNRRKLFAVLSGLDVDRAKGFFITDEGIFAYNKAADALTEVELDEVSESRMEVIAKDIDANLESMLRDCGRYRQITTMSEPS